MRYCRDKQISKSVEGLVRDGWLFSQGNCAHQLVVIRDDP